MRIRREFYANIIIIFLTFGLFLASIGFAQNSLPETPEEIKMVGPKILKSLPYSLKEFLKGIWQGILEFCQMAWGWLKIIWNSYIFPFLDNIWQKIKTPFEKEIKERKTIIKEEFKKRKRGAKRRTANSWQIPLAKI